MRPSRVDAYEQARLDFKWKHEHRELKRRYRESKEVIDIDGDISERNDYSEQNYSKSVPSAVKGSEQLQAGRPQRLEKGRDVSKGLIP